MSFKSNYLKPPILILSIIISLGLYAQDSSKIDNILYFPGKLLEVLNKKASTLQARIDLQTESYLARLQKKEQRMRKKLMRKDSSLAHSLFDDVSVKYNKLSKEDGQLSSKSTSYSGRLDSLSTALNFLNQTKAVQSGNPEIQALLEKYKELQNSLNQSDKVRAFINQRKQLLKEQFQKLGIVKQFKAYEKQVYYYQQQIAEYKERLNDPEKVGEMLLAVALKMPAFKSFFAQNSILGSLFPMPSSGGSSNVSINGLQTRAMINQSIINRLGNGVNVNQTIQQNMQTAQDQLGLLKNKISSFNSGSYGNSENPPPDFTPNTQKTKSFLKRLEYGTDFQNQKSNTLLPVTTNLGLTLGYRINDKKVIGIGATLKIGWGNGLQNLQLSYEGLGIRSFLNYKIKGSIAISGGYERNYLQLNSSIAQLKGSSNWQKSGLIGLTKQFSVSKKFNSNLQLLWDFLSYQQIPRTQPILFRVGYQIK